MNLLPLIEAKRDGQAISPSSWQQLVCHVTDGTLHEHQLSALLMAVLFQGMDAAETRALTLAMRDSGEVLGFPADERPLADKHSTGGVGDKVSLVLAPLLACLGFRVPMISGRGLGITGGTLDKLESIPGLTTRLSPVQLVAQVQSIGVAMGAATERMAPADRRLYALRDATGTVPSIPLITASILSKKLAEGIGALVLDVKYGRGAFMATRLRARELADALVTLANGCGVKTRALLTPMDAPLGRAAGNGLEVREVVRALEGDGPPDLMALTVDCAAHLAVMVGQAKDLSAARTLARQRLASGAPRAKFDELIAAQGADLDAFARKLAQDTSAAAVRDVAALEGGFVTRCDARQVGELVRDLGAGRMTQDAKVFADVGVDSLAKPGEQVRRGALLGRVHAATKAQAEKAAARLRAAFELADTPPPMPELIAEVVEA